MADTDVVAACQASEAAWHAFGEASGPHGSEALADEAHAKLWDAIDAVCDTPATTMAGLRAKARLSRLIPDDVDVIASLLDDLTQ
jgi:hypothetical protein